VGRYHGVDTENVFVIAKMRRESAIQVKLTEYEGKYNTSGLTETLLLPLWIQANWAYITP
jgi:hypothetical protein